MSETLTCDKVHCGTDAIIDVVFIHGLNGDPKETWVSEGDSEYWPLWLAESFDDIDIYCLGYPASIFQKWANKEMDIFERANSALDYMISKGFGSRPIVFITHSLGGILAKCILKKSSTSSDEQTQHLCDNTAAIVFLATPHTGSSLANAVKFVFPRTSSTTIELLSKDAGVLEEINDDFRKLCASRDDLKVIVYYEKYKTSKTAIVVDRSSSDPGIIGTTPVAADKDHINISKPKDRDDPIYLGICRHVENCCKAAREAVRASEVSFQSEDYSEKHTDDRRDLLEKLIAADREHEYQEANGHQSRFARQYMKHGLYTVAREQNDQILSDVRQRFLTHIYHQLICKDASDGDVTKALQKDVIDPICEKWSNIRGFSSTTVLQALYFLTEQCHIRWDKAS